MSKPNCSTMTPDDKVQYPSEAFKCCLGNVCNPLTKGCQSTWDEYLDKMYGCFYDGYNNVLDHTVNHCVDDANTKTMEILKPLMIWILIIATISLTLTLGIVAYNHFSLEYRLNKIERKIK